MNQGHANGHAVVYLFGNHGLRPIGHIAGNFESADHGTRVHHDGLRRTGSQPLTMQLIASGVLLEVDVYPGQPLLLDAQHHHNLRLLERAIEISLDGDAGTQFQGRVRQERGRPAEQDAGSEPGQQKRIGASHAGVQNVAGNRHRNALEQGFAWGVFGPAQGTEHGSHVQQRLGGMFVHAIPGVQHRQTRWPWPAGTGPRRKDGAG